MSEQQPPSGGTPEPAPAAKPKRRRSPGLVLGSLILPGLIAASGLAAYWTLSTDSGTRWLLGQFPGLTVTGAQGSVLGDFSAQRLVYELPDSADRIQIDDLRWQGLTLGWNRSPRLWADVTIPSLQARRVLVDLKPSTEPTTAPTDLHIPLGLKVDVLKVAELSIPSLSEQPFTELQAMLSLSEAGGQHHLLQLARLRWDHLQLQGQLQQDADAALGTQARLTLQSTQTEDGLPAWMASAVASGNLNHLQLKAELNSAKQSLQAQAQLQPFADWPLAELKARTAGLDLSALWSAAPRTALHGELTLHHVSPPARPKVAVAATLPRPHPQPLGALSIQTQLRNDRAGRWNEGSLPVRELSLDLNLQADDPASLRLRKLDVQLGSAAAPAGRLRALGQSASRKGSELTLQLDDLRSEGLDARLQSLQAQGSVNLQTEQTVNQLGSGPLPGLKIQANLDGRWLNSGVSTPLRLQLQAEADSAGLKVPQLRLSADAAAQLDLQGQWQLKQAGQLRSGWRLQSQAQLQAPDLRRLWLADQNKAWQQQAQSLQAQLQVDLDGASPPNSKPGSVKAGSVQSWLDQLPTGRLEARLQSASLMGLPLDASLLYQRAATPASEPQLDVQMRAREQQLDAQLAWRESRRWVADIKVQAPQLQALQSMWNVLEPGSKLQGRVQGQGRWQAEPDMRSPRPTWAQLPWQSQGSWQVQGLHWLAGEQRTALQLGRAQLDWSVQSAQDAQQQLSLQLNDLQQGSWNLPRAQLQWQGRWAQHELKLLADANLPLPASLLADGQTRGQSAQGPIQLVLQGGLSASPVSAWLEGGQWQARQLSLSARPQDSKLPPWLHIPQASPQWRWGPKGEGMQASVPPGQLQLLGANLAWRELHWRADPTGSTRPGALWPDVRLDVQLQPLALAPLLARWQPDFGWGGDLQMQGRLQLSTRPQLRLDAVLERSQGDLQVTEDLGVQRLGLSELRLGLIGSPGVWHFSHALAGSQIGVMAGAVTARHDTDLPWPDARAKLEGVLEARVANLATWGAWVPAGWRLGGSLYANGSYGGQLKAPQVHGRAGAKNLSIRNPLLGVDWRDGEMLVEFEGAKAQLRQLSARAGDGDLKAQGQLNLGDQPSATLHLDARQFGLLRRVDRRITVSGQMDMRLGEQLRELQGKLRVDEGLLDFSKGDAPSLDDDVEVLHPEQHRGEPKAPAHPLQIRLALDMGDKLRLRGHGIDTLLRGELVLTQPKGEPVLHGVLRTEDGSFEAYGQKLAIEKGLLSFVGPYDNPRIEFLALRPNNEDVKVGVSVTGTAHAPRIKLYADPDDKTDSEKLSWLLLGRAPDDLGRGDSALLQRAALALLSGDGKSRTGTLIKSLGFDELSVSDGGGDAKGTVVRLGKQLSKRWYVGYERSLNSATGSWQLIYRIAQRFTLRGQSGDDNALDLIWQWKWD